MGYRYTIPVQYKDALALFYHHPQVLLQSQIEPHNFAEFQQFPIFNFVTFCIHLLKMISVIPKKILLHFNNVHVDTTLWCVHILNSTQIFLNGSKVSIMCVPNHKKFVVYPRVHTFSNQILKEPYDIIIFILSSTITSPPYAPFCPCTIKFSAANKMRKA